MFSGLILSPEPNACRTIRRLSVDTHQVSIGGTLSHLPTPYEMDRIAITTCPDIVFIDLRALDRSSLEILEDLRTALPGTALVGFGSPPMSSRESIGVLEAVDACLGVAGGLDEFRNTVKEAIRCVDRTIHGNLFAFLPSKAGSGCSVTALNIAGRVTTVLGRTVLLIDGDTRSGILSVLTGSSPRLELQDAIRSIHTIGRAEWHSNHVASRFGADLLLGKPSTGRSLVEWHHYYQLLRFVSSEYDFVFVDLPEAVNDATAEAVSRARSVFIVCTPELLSIELARQRKQELAARGVDLGRVSVILNRATPRGIPPDRIEELLDLQVAITLPNDYHSILESTINSEMVNSASHLGRAYLAAAETLVGAPISGDRESLVSRIAATLGSDWMFSRRQKAKQLRARAPS